MRSTDVFAATHETFKGFKPLYLKLYLSGIGVGEGADG
jgi:hypothetical protein